MLPLFYFLSVFYHRYFYLSTLFIYFCKYLFYLHFSNSGTILEAALKDGDFMAWSYDLLWKLLIDRKMKRTDLIALAGINSRTLAKMGKNETVSMDALGKICQLLNCEIGDIVEYLPDSKN